MNTYCPRKASNNWSRHRYGQCVELVGYTYVPVPKSASTWCKQLWHVGSESNFLDVKQDRDYVVILRDPLERWISGFAQCQVGNDPRVPDYWKTLGWHWVFDTIVFDNHTEPQSSFLAGIDLDCVTWFRQDNKLERLMLDWMQKHLGLDQTSVAADRYVGREQPAPVFRNGVTGPTQAEIMAEAEVALNSIVGARERIQEYYQEDFDLYQGVEYYRC